MDIEEVSGSAKNKRKLLIVFGLTATYFFAEVAGGILTRSLALLADAGHMLTDVAGLGLSLLAIWFSQRPATLDRTYGYHRVEILAAVINAMVLIGISIYVLFEAYKRFVQPPPVESNGMLAVAAVGLVINVISMLMLKDSAHDSLNVKGAYFEVLSDMLTSIGVIAAGLIMKFTGWYYADPIVSAVIGFLILPRTWHLLQEAVGVLLEGTPREVNLVALRKSVEALDGVASTHDLHVWSITSGMNAASLHVVLAADFSHEQVLRSVQDVVKKHKIDHVTVQIETSNFPEHPMHL